MAWRDTRSPTPMLNIRVRVLLTLVRWMTSSIYLKSHRPLNNRIIYLNRFRQIFGNYGIKYQWEENLKNKTKQLKKWKKWEKMKNRYFVLGRQLLELQHDLKSDPLVRARK